MKLFSLAAALIASTFVFSAEAQDSRPMCNVVSNSRCVVSYGYDNSYSNFTCADKTLNSSSCTAYCSEYFEGQYCMVYLNAYDAGCAQADLFTAGTSCSNLYGYRDGEQPSTEAASEDRTTCGSTGAYCGWRDNVNKSGNGSSNAARAKLHSCAVNGHSDESYYGTSTSACYSYSSNTSINGFCSSGTWESLCASASY